MAWVCAAGCATRANQFLSGPQFPLWPSEWTKDSTREGHTALTGGSLCTLPLQGLAESRAKKIRGFPTKPLYSLAAGAGLESQENGHNPCRGLRSPNARLSLLPNCP